MLDRTIAPSSVQTTAFDLLKPERKILPNGIELFFVSGGSQDVLKVEIVFRAGRWYEKTWGSTYFAAHLLSKGTKAKSSFEIAKLFDKYGAHIEISSGLDFVSISLYSLTKNLKPAVDLLQEIMLEPVFPEKELDQAKAIYLQNLKVNEEKTSFLASKYFRKKLFGESHPYGKELEEKDISDLTQEDLFFQYQTSFVQPLVFVSGKIESKNSNFITESFSAWPVGNPVDRVVAHGSISPEPQRIEKKDSVQSSIRLGNHSLTRQHKDYSKVIFVGHILGGYFGSRLMKNIREEKGLTYGIYSSIHPLKHGSYMVIGADVNNENVTLTIEEIRKELKRLRDEKISSAELGTAKNHFIGSLQSEITNPFAHADKIKTLHLFGLPQDYYQQMIRTIKEMNATDIVEISELHFNENTLIELAVG